MEFEKKLNFLFNIGEDEMNLTEKDLERWKGRKCAEPGCWNYNFAGYIYCVHHLYEHPSKLPEEVIKVLKEQGVK